MARFQTWRNGPGCLPQCLGGNARKLGLAKIDDKDLLHQLSFDFRKVTFVGISSHDFPRFK